MILFDVRSLENSEHSGVHVVTAQLCRALAAQVSADGFRAVANTRRGAERVRATLGPDVPLTIRRVPNKLLHAAMRFMGRPTLEDLAGHDGPATVIANAHFLSLRPDSRLALLVHDVSYFRDKAFFSRRQRLWHRLIQMRRLVARADRIVVFSAHTARDLTELFGVPFERILQVTPGLDPVFRQAPAAITVGALRARYKLPRRYALVLGSGPRKNTEIVALALRAIPDLHVVVTGSAASLHSSRWHDVPHVSAPERAALLAGAEMLFYPSFYEGFGLPPLEAFALGVPVIASHTTSIPEVTGEAALLFDPQDATAFIDAIRLVRADRKATQSRVARGRAWVSGDRWETAATALLTAIRQIEIQPAAVTIGNQHHFVIH